MSQYQEFGLENIQFEIPIEHPKRNTMTQPDMSLKFKVRSELETECEGIQGYMKRYFKIIFIHFGLK